MWGVGGCSAVAAPGVTLGHGRRGLGLLQRPCPAPSPSLQVGLGAFSREVHSLLSALVQGGVPPDSLPEGEIQSE